MNTDLQPLKTHPKDWENPGRVKVQLRTAEGTPRNPSIKNSKRCFLFVRARQEMCRMLTSHLLPPQS
ncbi:hypothetical protein B8W95_13910, partial [Staphylococcus pasteuri]